MAGLVTAYPTRHDAGIFATCRCPTSHGPGTRGARLWLKVLAPALCTGSPAAGSATLAATERVDTAGSLPAGRHVTHRRHNRGAGCAAEPGQVSGTERGKGSRTRNSAPVWNCRCRCTVSASYPAPRRVYVPLRRQGVARAERPVDDESCDRPVGVEPSQMP